MVALMDIKQRPLVITVGHDQRAQRQHCHGETCVVPFVSGAKRRREGQDGVARIAAGSEEPLHVARFYW